MLKQFDPIIQKNVTSWLEEEYDDETKNCIKQLIINNPKEIEDAFFSSLNFGTGGLRSLMGVGPNRLNKYTVRSATQGLANYICQYQNHPLSVFIGYDSRHLSRTFAEESAKVLAANQISVYLFKDIRPTPLLSFSCKQKNCIAGIMITASHNPPHYNGYKIYWSDGGQIVTPHDEKITIEMAKITSPSQVKGVDSIFHPLIKEVEMEMDQAYEKTMLCLQHFPEDNNKFGKGLQIVYTSLHGTGVTMVPKVLSSWGFTSIDLVDKQSIPDGNFPTISSPNPEDHKALKLGNDQLVEMKGDILIATDPDADRMGLSCLHQGQPYIFNGNQIACICLDHICQNLLSQKKFPPNGYFVKTIATTELFKAICDYYQKPCYDVLTGFKYIAKKILELEPDKHHFIFGGEESYGYLLGSYVRDKDAIISAALISEVALQAKLNGMTLVDKLYHLYQRHGIYYETVFSLDFEHGNEGKEQMIYKMDLLRNGNLKKIENLSIEIIDDYLTSTRIQLKTGKKEILSLPHSDVIVFWLDDGTKILIRPSGTEPKMKIYLGVKKRNFVTVELGLESARIHSQNLLESILKMLR